jgi:TPR repeat protein
MPKEKIKSPFSREQRNKLLHLSRQAKETNILSPAERKIIYEAGHYNFIFVNRLKSLHDALENLEREISEDDVSQISNLAIKSYLEVRSSEGDAEAQYLLGLAKYYGFHGLEQDVDTSCLLLEKSSNQGHIDATSELGSIFLMEKNAEKGLEFLESAISKGSIQAKHSLALAFMHKQIDGFDYEDAISLLKQSSDEGEPVSMRIMGKIYYEFSSKVGSEKKALALWRASGEAGDVKSMSLLGLHMLFHEHESLQDEAYEWLKKAADEFEPDACFRLGERYYKGLGVDIDYDEAFEYFMIGDILGNVESTGFLGKCYFHGRGIDEDDDKAFHYFDKAAADGHLSSIVYLGICYSDGLGVEKDSEEAFRLFNIAAEEEHPDAHFLLGELIRNSDETEENLKKAFECFLEGAQQKNVSAYYAVGRAYYLGEGINENNSEAVKWLSLAVDNEHSEAKYLLGECYLKGFGVEIDHMKAYDLLSSASIDGIESAEEMINEFGLSDVENSNDTLNAGVVKSLFNPLEVRARRVFDDISISSKSDINNLKPDNVISFTKKYDERLKIKLSEEK